MASGNIGEVPAASYAEYVQNPLSSFLAPHDEEPDGASDASSEDESRSSDDPDAPSEDALQRAAAVARCPTVAVRPGLAHRLYSHRLHVRAKAKLQRDRLLSGPMLDVYVGASKRHWALHRNLLCHHSELLEAELQPDDKKKPVNLELPDHDPAGFELLVKWLYQGTLDDVSDMADANQKYDYAVSCHKLYLLCDRFDLAQLKNIAMDQYRKGLNEAELVPDADEIDDIYRKSPLGSPFRRLMTRIAARQIMDPSSERDAETYRMCFENNPDFAIDLVKAMKHGTGGMLFDDPTDAGNECEYHDHDAGPNCHIKGKGKTKQALKASALPRDPKYARSDQSGSSDLPLRRHLPYRPLLNPPPPPRQARLQDGKGGVGPLRRRLTSPASSTVETSTEHATAKSQSPNERRDKFRRVTPPEKHLTSPALTEEMASPPVPADSPLSSGGESHQPLNSVNSEEGDRTKASPKSGELTSPSRGIWGWAKAGTGRLGIIGRMPHPEWTGPVTSKAAGSAVNGALEGGRTTESLDDFSLPSSTNTEPENVERRNEAAAAKIDGLGISNSTVDPHFAQTKRSSDDLVAAASINGSPSPQAIKSEHWPNGETNGDGETNGKMNTDDGAMSKVSMADEIEPPSTPSPAQRTKRMKDHSKDTPSPRRIPKYKIALSANMFNAARTVTT